jgi:hypothetical protein
MRESPERKGLDAFDELEISRGIIDEHKGSSELREYNVLAPPYPHKPTEVKALAGAFSPAI